MKTPADPIFDHALAVTFTALKDPMERTRFYRANRDAIGREEGRVRRGEPLPSSPNINAKAEPFPRGLTIKRNGVVMRHIPSRGLFGQ